MAQLLGSHLSLFLFSLLSNKLLSGDCILAILRHCPSLLILVLQLFAFFDLLFILPEIILLLLRLFSSEPFLSLFVSCQFLLLGELLLLLFDGLGLEHGFSLLARLLFVLAHVDVFELCPFLLVSENTLLTFGFLLSSKLFGLYSLLLCALLHHLGNQFVQAFLLLYLLGCQIFVILIEFIRGRLRDIVCRSFFQGAQIVISFFDESELL
jgi:hypothetical protein